MAVISVKKNCWFSAGHARSNKCIVKVCKSVETSTFLVLVVISTNVIVNWPQVHGLSSFDLRVLKLISLL